MGSHDRSWLNPLNGKTLSSSSLVSFSEGCTVTSFTKGKDMVLSNGSLEMFSVEVKEKHRGKKHIGFSKKAAAVVMHKVAWQVEVHVKCAPGEKEKEEEEEEGRLNLCQSTKAKGA